MANDYVYDGYNIIRQMLNPSFCCSSLLLTNLSFIRDVDSFWKMYENTPPNNRPGSVEYRNTLPAVAEDYILGTRGEMTKRPAGEFAFVFAYVKKTQTKAYEVLTEIGFKSITDDWVLNTKNATRVKFLWMFGPEFESRRKSWLETAPSTVKKKIDVKKA